MPTESLLEQQHGGVRVGQHVFELRRLVQGVHRDQDTPRHGHAVGARHPLGPVGHQEADTGPLADPRGQQPPGDPAGLVSELVVGPAGGPRGAALPEGQCLAVPVTPDDLGEEASKGEGTDPVLGLRGWPGECRHAGISTSTGPLAMTAPSWVVITTSMVTTPVPRVGS